MATAVFCAAVRGAILATVARPTASTLHARAAAITSVSVWCCVPARGLRNCVFVPGVRLAPPGLYADYPKGVPDNATQRQRIKPWVKSSEPGGGALRKPPMARNYYDQAARYVAKLEAPAFAPWLLRMRNLLFHRW